MGVAAVTPYLINTGDGLILVDTTFHETAPMVAQAIEDLGFRVQDIKIILGSHAHADHQGGTSWFLERAPNAQLMILEGDAATVEAGVPAQPHAHASDKRLDRNTGRRQSSGLNTGDRW